jgi:hypothetical protein
MNFCTRFKVSEIPEIVHGTKVGWNGTADPYGSRKGAKDAKDFINLYL